MCENEQKPELDSEPWKGELRSRSSVIFTTAPQPWKTPHCTWVHGQSRV